MSPTLYERIGGKATVEKACRLLYVNILRDDRINQFFKNIDMKKQERMMNSFMTYICGGPSLYTGRDMRRAHEKVVKEGLNDAHVDAMLEDVSAVLHELNVPQDTITEVISVFEKHRDDMLNR